MIYNLSLLPIYSNDIINYNIEIHIINKRI